MVRGCLLCVSWIGIGLCLSQLFWYIRQYAKHVHTHIHPPTNRVSVFSQLSHVPRQTPKTLLEIAFNYMVKLHSTNPTHAICGIKRNWNERFIELNVACTLCVSACVCTNQFPHTSFCRNQKSIPNYRQASSVLGCFKYCGSVYEQSVCLRVYVCVCVWPRCQHKRAPVLHERTYAIPNIMHTH